MWHNLKTVAFNRHLPETEFIAFAKKHHEKYKVLFKEFGDDIYHENGEVNTWNVDQLVLDFKSYYTLINIELWSAAEIVVTAGIGSGSLLQKKLGITYNEGCDLLQKLEVIGIVGPKRKKFPREVLVKSTNELSNYFIKH
jgi:hypothetical protein